MAVDLRIGSVETTLSTADPAAIRTPQFMAAVVAAVKQELARDQALADQRASDSALSHHGRRR